MKVSDNGSENLCVNDCSSDSGSSCDSENTSLSICMGSIVNQKILKSH